MIQLVQLSTWPMYQMPSASVENEFTFLASLTAILIKLPTWPNIACWCLRSWNPVRTYGTHIEAIREIPHGILIGFVLLLSYI